jgi:hypothetical protein
MDLRFALIILSGILAAVASLPYLIDVVKHRTKPRVATWVTWNVMKTIAVIAAFVEHEYITAILLSVSLMGTLSILILGWEYGNKKIEPVDIVCLIGVMIGIILWAIFNSPAIGVLAVIVIDSIGGIPTIIHAWKNPHEETWVTFLLSLLAAGCILLTVIDWRITAFAFPLYLVIMDLSLVILIVSRRLVTNK